MPGRSNAGVCARCSAQLGMRAMKNHHAVCPAGQAGSAEMVLLRVRPPDAPIYWLDVEAPATAKLSAVDKLLREVWLECCGHLSQFTDPARRAVGKSRAVGEVLGQRGDTLFHCYDFGSSTWLRLDHLALRRGLARPAARVLARNLAPVWPCDECGLPSACICVECANEGRGLLCEAHAAEHECGEEMLLPVVNSPRMGVCGYTGEF